jgi:hypothetical protein
MRRQETKSLSVNRTRGLQALEASPLDLGVALVKARRQRDYLASKFEEAVRADDLDKALRISPALNAALKTIVTIAAIHIRRNGNQIYLRPTRDVTIPTGLAKPLAKLTDAA